MPTTETITATIQRARTASVWLYRKPDTGWGIFKTNKGVFKGTVPFEPKESDVLQFDGSWQKSKFNGSMEFIFRTALLSIPEEPRALLHLAVTWTKGLGEAKEATIWEVYGTEWIKATYLEKIGGLSLDTRWNWNDTLKRLESEQAQAQAVSFLMSKGASLNMASVAWERWKEDTVSRVSANCYILSDLPHYGFAHVDAIRVGFGISDEDQRRIDAAVLYVHGQVTGRGDTVSSWQELVEGLLNLIPYTVERFEDAVKRLIDSGKLVQLGSVFDDEQMFCVKADWDDEVVIWGRFGK